MEQVQLSTAAPASARLPFERSDSAVLVEPGQLPAFEKRLAALNKKAAAFGLSPITVASTTDVLYEVKYEYTGRDQETLIHYLVPCRDPKRVDHPVLLKRIEIAYPLVKLGNWQVVGKLEAITGGNLTFAITANEADREALDTHAAKPLVCEHCNAKRNRKDGYLLRESGTGAFKQVGSQCLEDFTGLDPAAALFLAKMAGTVRIAEGEMDDLRSGGRANSVSTLNFLVQVAFLAERFGFVSATKARAVGETATFQEAMALPHELLKSRALSKAYAEQFDRLLEKAQAIRAWTLGKDEESSFDRNLKLLIAQDYIALDPKHLAFVAAAVPSYDRMLNKQAEARAPSTYVGTVGERMQARLTLDRVLEIDSPYGVTRMVLLRDACGNRIRWKTASCPSEISNGRAGLAMEATFKVKRHSDYNGSAQTDVTHLKVTNWIDSTTPQPACP